MFPDYLTSNYQYQLLKVLAMLDDFVVAGRQNCLFVFTRWNGGGTPMRQNTEFMYVSREHIEMCSQHARGTLSILEIFSNISKLHKLL